MAFGKILLLLGVALATGCATAPSPRLIQYQLVVHRAAEPAAAMFVPAAQAGTSLPWAPTPIPAGSISVDGPFGEALNVAARLHRRLNAMGIKNEVTCRQAADAGAANEIRIDLPSAGKRGEPARLAALSGTKRH